MLLKFIIRFFMISSGAEMGSISWDLFQLTPHLSVGWVLLKSMGSFSVSLSSIRRLMRVLDFTYVDCKDGFTSEMDSLGFTYVEITVSFLCEATWARCSRRLGPNPQLFEGKLPSCKKQIFSTIVCTELLLEFSNSRDSIFDNVVVSEEFGANSTKLTKNPIDLMTELDNRLGHVDGSIDMESSIFVGTWGLDSRVADLQICEVYLVSMCSSRKGVCAARGQNMYENSEEAHFVFDVLDVMSGKSLELLRIFSLGSKPTIAMVDKAVSCYLFVKLLLYSGSIVETSSSLILLDGMLANGISKDLMGVGKVGSRCIFHSHLESQVFDGFSVRIGRMMRALLGGYLSRHFCEFILCNVFVKAGKFGLQWLAKGRHPLEDSWKMSPVGLSRFHSVSQRSIEKATGACNAVLSRGDFKGLLNWYVDGEAVALMMEMLATASLNTLNLGSRFQAGVLNVNKSVSYERDFWNKFWIIGHILTAGYATSLWGLYVIDFKMNVLGMGERITGWTEQWPGPYVTQGNLPRGKFDGKICMNTNFNVANVGDQLMLFGELAHYVGDADERVLDTSNMWAKEGEQGMSCYYLVFCLQGRNVHDLMVVMDCSRPCYSKEMGHVFSTGVYAAGWDARLDGCVSRFLTGMKPDVGGDVDEEQALLPVPVIAVPWFLCCNILGGNLWLSDAQGGCTRMMHKDVGVGREATPKELNSWHSF